MAMTEEALKLLLNKASDNVLKNVAVAGSAHPLALRQEGYSLEDLERFLPAPLTLKQTVSLQSPQAFVAYVNKFKETRTVVFVTEQTFTAKLDYHGPTLPSWCRHTASYTPKASHQWQAWAKHNKEVHDQMEFADFLEERLAEILVPTAAEVLTAILNFKESVGYTLESAKDLRNGQVNYAFVKQGQPKDFNFPHDITLMMPIFDYHAAQTLKAEIRYTSTNGALALWYRLSKDPIDIVREHFDQISEGIREQLTDVPFFEGKAG